MNRLNSMNQNTKPTDAIAEIAWSTDVINRNYLDNMYIISENYETINDFKNRLLVLQKEVEKSNTEKDITAPIVLSTIHSSKGLEYDTVYMVDVYEGRFPSSRPNIFCRSKDSADGEQEERRLFYVGITRAKNKLHLFEINERESSYIDELFPKSRMLDFKSKKKNERSLWKNGSECVLSKCVYNENAICNNKKL